MTMAKGVKEDTCAFFLNEKCTILKVFYAGKHGCLGCTFFKTRTRANDDRKRAELSYFRHTGQTIEQYQERREE